MEQYVDRRTVLAGVAALAVVSGVALIAAPGGLAQEASPEASPAATPGAGGDEVTITSHDIFFDPTEVTIAADKDVKIILPNKGVTLHNFSITDHKNENLPFDPIDVDIDPGATKEVTIKAPAGEYYYFCNVPGHEAAGMHGILTAK